MVIVAASENAARQLLQAFPFLPPVEGDSAGLLLGPPNVEGGAAPRRCAWGHPFTECEIDMLPAVVIAEGAQAYFEVVEELPADWEQGDQE